MIYIPEAHQKKGRIELNSMGVKLFGDCGVFGQYRNVVMPVMPSISLLSEANVTQLICRILGQLRLLSKRKKHGKHEPKLKGSGR